MTKTTLRRFNKQRKRRFAYYFFIITFVGGLIVRVVSHLRLLQSSYYLASSNNERSISFLDPPQAHNNDSSHNNKNNEATTTANLSYGVELSYILPLKVLHEAAAAVSGVKSKNTNIAKRFKALQKECAKDVIMSLQEHSIPATIFEFDKHDEDLEVVPPPPALPNNNSNSWLIPLENRGGLEVASYVNPPRDEIHLLMKVFVESHFQIDSDINAIHINVDARNRSIDEIRNVYKNYLAVEDAIDKIRTSTTITVSGFARPMGKKYRSTSEAYQAMHDPMEFPYPSYSHRILPDGSIIQDPDSKMSSLCLRNNPTSSNETQRFEFRGIQPSLDSNVVWSWIQFARKFVEVSYSGVVLEPKDRSTHEQWEALFGEIIQDTTLEYTLKAWGERDMYIANPNRKAIIEAVCPFVSKTFCYTATRGIVKRNRKEKKREKWMETGMLNKMENEILTNNKRRTFRAEERKRRKKKKESPLP